MMSDKAEPGAGAATAEADVVVAEEDGSEDEEVAVTSEKDAPPTSQTSKRFWLAIKVLVFLGLVAFTIAAFVINADRAITLLYFWAFIAFVVLVKLINRFAAPQVKTVCDAFNRVETAVTDSKPLSIGVGVLLTAVVVILIAVSVDDASRLISAAGLVVIILFTWMTSFKPRQVKWRPVIGGLLFQFIFGFLIMRTTPGFVFFQFIGDQVTALLDYAKAGSTFLFGWTNTFQGWVLLRGFDGSPQMVENANGQMVEKLLTLPPLFATNVLPTVIFFSSLVSILYYLGILQVLIRIIGSTLAFLLGTSASESLNAAGNIFVGQTEAPLLIRPFLKDMTASEIHAVMVGGFATIAGGVLAIYLSFGIEASHLLAASVMSAPAALALSKLAYPETEQSKTAAGMKYEIEVPDQVNVIEAASQGATDAIRLALTIGGQLIAFISLIAMFNAWLGYFGSYIDVPDLSFEMLSGYVLYPVAYLMGVEADDCIDVATLLGYKIFVNEFLAYEKLRDLIGAEAISKRSEIIATYALCGFANFGSIGIQLGGLTPLAPNQAKVFARVVFSAMIVGNSACFLTACIAGLLYDTSRDL